MCMVVVIAYWRASRHSVPLTPQQGRQVGPSRRWLLRAMGLLWILDGLLQMQPAMVTRFIGGFLVPQVVGQPLPIAWLVRWGISVWSLNPPILNSLAAFFQIAIGLGLLLSWGEPARRRALWASIVWGLIVWAWGEAMGGVFAGGTWMTGAPGSALIYALVSMLLLPGDTWWERQSVSWFKLGFAGLFALSAILEVLPGWGQWSGALSGNVLAMAQMPQPSVFSRPLYVVAAGLALHPILWNAIVTGILVTLSVAWVLGSRNRIVCGFTALWVFLTWWIGQDFGVLGGMGTDPNSGAVILLILYAYAGQIGLVRFPSLRRQMSVNERDRMAP